MPIRTATVTHQIQKNGARLHLAMVSRAHSQGEGSPPSELERALLEERRSLKEARALRQAQAKLPKPKAVKLIAAPKAPKLGFRVWSRSPNASEVALIVKYAEAQQQRIASGGLAPEIQLSENAELKQLIASQSPESKASLMACIMTARALMNTDEAVTKP